MSKNTGRGGSDARTLAAIAVGVPALINLIASFPPMATNPILVIACSMTGGLTTLVLPIMLAKRVTDERCGHFLASMRSDGGRKRRVTMALLLVLYVALSAVGLLGTFGGLSDGVPIVLDAALNCARGALLAGTIFVHQVGRPHKDAIEA